MPPVYLFDTSAANAIIPFTVDCAVIAKLYEQYVYIILASSLPHYMPGIIPPVHFPQHLPAHARAAGQLRSRQRAPSSEAQLTSPPLCFRRQFRL